MANKFLDDKAAGDAAFDVMASHFRRAGCVQTRKDEKNSEFDGGFRLDGRHFLAESKSEVKRWHSTGNAAVEVWNPYKNHPAGLTSTRAAIWSNTFMPQGWVYVTRPELLWNYIHTHPPKLVRIGGDNNNSLLWLYKKEDYWDFTYRIDDLPGKEVAAILNKLLSINVWE